VTAGGCEEVTIRLSAWIDGELGASEAAQVREHLAGCAACRRRHALLTAAGAAVRSLPAETVSASFEDAFRRRLAAARTPAWRRRGRAVWITAAGLAAVLVLVVVGLFVSRTTPTPRVVPRAGSHEAPLWLAACGASTAVECYLETPCASSAACGVALDGEPSLYHARLPEQAGPCASAADCGVGPLTRWQLSAGHANPARRERWP
jgi:hypothetical protein